MPEHPLAEAVVNRIKSMQDVKALKIADFKAVPGSGVTGNVIFPDGRTAELHADSSRFLSASEIAITSEGSIRENADGSTVILLAENGIAAGALYPLTGFMLNPAAAGTMMALSCISVVTNSLRLKYRKI